MSDCDMCGSQLADAQTFGLGCGCGWRSHIPCIAAAAQRHFDATGDPRGWTACLKCGKPIGNGPLVELLLKLWARSLRNENEKLSFYGEAATVFERRKMFSDAAKAVSNQVAIYVKHGHTLATSRPMLNAKRRFGQLAYRANCPKPAIYAFYDILQHAGVNGAWLGGEDLAFVFMLMQHYEKAYLALHKCLFYKSIIGKHDIPKFELALCEVDPDKRADGLVVLGLSETSPLHHCTPGGAGPENFMRYQS